MDDEPMARTLLRLMLVRAGFEVVEAKDGHDALEKLKENRPDLVILDVMMPGMDGFTVCSTMRSQPTTADVPVIMLSAKTDMGSVNKGLTSEPPNTSPNPSPRNAHPPCAGHSGRSQPHLSINKAQ
ncbi:MAG: response regulator [Chloroflexi bacterium]|nr:response regulator [Chloroflexota bacterium]